MPDSAFHAPIDRCTCRTGRDHDGSEFGPCAFCEALADGLVADERELIAEDDCWSDADDLSRAYKLDFDEDPRAWRERYWGVRLAAASSLGLWVLVVAAAHAVGAV